MIRRPAFRQRLAWLASILPLLVACPAWAQVESLPGSYVSPSVRSGGMGGAGVALPADDPFVAFLNPALLSHARGIHWGHSSTRLLPEFTSDVFLKADYITVGLGGLGFEFSGRPFSALGGTRLDYGTGLLTDPGGGAGNDSVFSFHSYEDIREFAFSADVLHTLHGLLLLSGHRVPDVANYFDISLGMRWKRYQVYSPINFGTGLPDTAETPSGTARDKGVLVRVTPYHNVSGDFRNGALQTGGKLAGIGGLAIELFGGASMLNSAADPVHITFFDSTTPVARVRRLGIGARLATGLPRALQDSDIGDVPKAARYLGPTAVLSLGFDAIQRRDSTDSGPDFSTAHAVGAELTILGVLTGRLGHYRDARGEIDGSTAGIGLRLHYADAFSLSYEWASRPQATGLQHVHPHAWQVLVNPYGVLKVLLGG